MAKLGAVRLGPGCAGTPTLASARLQGGVQSTDALPGHVASEVTRRGTPEDLGEVATRHRPGAQPCDASRRGHSAAPRRGGPR